MNLKNWFGVLCLMFVLAAVPVFAQSEPIIGRWECYLAVGEDKNVTPILSDDAYAEFYEDNTYIVHLEDQLHLIGKWSDIAYLLDGTDYAYSLENEDNLMIVALPEENDQGEFSKMYLMAGNIMFGFKFDKTSSPLDFTYYSSKESSTGGSTYSSNINDGSSNVSSSGNGSYGSSATMGEKNALKKAQSYLSVSPFSYSGLIEQLEYSGFSHSEAVYAADHCGANWKDQALAKAKSYLSVSAFSYSGLIDQLEYSGFTTAEAAYGANNCGADWYEQAAEKAASYLKISSFSRSQLIDQLEYSGFTHEQAVYGATKNGY